MRHRHTRRNGPEHPAARYIDQIRDRIAFNLHLDPGLVQYGELGHSGKLGTSDPHWLFFWRGRWCELPWHFDGPTCVTWDLIRRWYPIRQRVDQ